MKAVVREKYPIPTVEEIMHEFNGSTIFTKLDLRPGYHQIMLEEESRKLTAFACHRGLFCCRRLHFGFANAAESYHKYIELSLEGLDGVRNISDDLIVHGSNQEEHDKRLRCVFERLQGFLILVMCFLPKVFQLTQIKSKLF